MKLKFSLVLISIILPLSSNSLAQSIPEQDDGWLKSSNGKGFYSVQSRFYCPFKLETGMSLTNIHTFEPMPDVSCTYEDTSNGDFATYYLYPGSQDNSLEIEGSIKQILTSKTHSDKFKIENVEIDFGGNKISGNSILASNDSEGRKEAFELFKLLDHKVKIRETYFGDHARMEASSREFMALQKNALSQLKSCDAILKRNTKNAPHGEKMIGALVGGAIVSATLQSKKTGEKEIFNENLPPNVCVTDVAKDGKGEILSIRASDDPYTPYLVTYEIPNPDFSVAIAKMQNIESSDENDFMFIAYKIDGKAARIYDYFTELPSYSQALRTFNGIFENKIPSIANITIGENGEVQVDLDFESLMNGQ